MAQAAAAATAVAMAHGDGRPTYTADEPDLAKVDVYDQANPQEVNSLYVPKLLSHGNEQQGHCTEQQALVWLRHALKRNVTKVYSLRGTKQTSKLVRFRGAGQDSSGQIVRSPFRDGANLVVCCNNENIDVARISQLRVFSSKKEGFVTSKLRSLRKNLSRAGSFSRERKPARGQEPNDGNNQKSSAEQWCPANPQQPLERESSAAAELTPRQRAQDTQEGPMTARSSSGQGSVYEGSHHSDMSHPTDLNDFEGTTPRDKAKADERLQYLTQEMALLEANITAADDLKFEAAPAQDCLDAEKTVAVQAAAASAPTEPPAAAALKTSAARDNTEIASASMAEADLPQMEIVPRQAHAEPMSSAPAAQQSSSFWPFCMPTRCARGRCGLSNAADDAEDVPTVSRVE